MMTLNEIIPEADDLLTLQPEEIGGVILQILNSDAANKGSIHNRNAFCHTDTVKKYPKQTWESIKRVLVEGWQWLEAEGLIAQDPDQMSSWFFITRRGQQATSPNSFRTYRSTSVLRKNLLHPLIAEKVWSAFLRGDFDTAVFIAFKEIEIQVRLLSKQQNEVVGTDLMRRAFGSDGPLSPTYLPRAEQEALAHLFAGSIGWFKNPQSHRNVGLSHIDYAVQALMFASHLLYLADINIPGKIVKGTTSNEPSR